MEGDTLFTNKWKKMWSETYTKKYDFRSSDKYQSFKADSHVAVYRYECYIGSTVLSSWKQNISCYYFNFKTCADAEIPLPDNQLSFMLHELVFLVCHLQFALYPYTFASYSYGCKIFQPYVAATVRMHSNAVLSSTCALLIKTVVEKSCQ